MYPIHSRSLGLTLALALLAACNTAPIVGNTPDDETGSAASTLDNLAADANSTGDADAASAFGDGAAALRLGVRPTEIDVKIRGENVRYFALVTATVHNEPAGPYMVRSLLAWQGKEHPKAVLQISTDGDEATFGNPPPRAIGSWNDLANARRWKAMRGTVALKLASTGDPCVLPTAAAINCSKATFDFRLDGEFVSINDRAASPMPREEKIAIVSAALGINGVLIRR